MIDTFSSQDIFYFPTIKTSLELTWFYQILQNWHLGQLSMNDFFFCILNG